MLRQILQTGRLPIGVDFGPGGVKLLQLRRARGGYSVIGAGRVDYVDKAESLTDPACLKALSEGIRRRLEAGGFSGSGCVLSVDDELLRVRSVRQPRMPREEADKALRIEGPERLGFTRDDETEIGWIRAGEVRQGEDVRDELIVVGALRSDMEKLVDAISGAGLRPVAMEPAFVACGRTFSRTHRRASDQSIVRLVVNVGMRSTGVVVLRGSDVVFYKRLDIGGAALTAVAAEQLDLDPATAADLRRQRMQSVTEPGASKMDTRVDRAIFDAVRPLLDELANEVALCLRYYTVTFRGEKPECALIAGDDAPEPGLVDALGEALSVPTSVGRPLEGIDFSAAGATLERRSDMAEWAVAAGLSMFGDPLATASGSAKAPGAAGAGGSRESQGSQTREAA